jgi:hypothetical protein
MQHNVDPETNFMDKEWLDIKEKGEEEILLKTSVKYVKEVPNQYCPLEETANTLVVDTMQNSEIPHVGNEDQYGETYYHTLNSVLYILPIMSKTF